MQKLSTTLRLLVLGVIASSSAPADVVYAPVFHYGAEAEGGLSPAFATTNETALDAIFSQASFGGNPIDIQFNPQTTAVGPKSIQNAAQLNAVFALGTNLSPTVNMIFVDVIDWCGSFNVNIVGCANRPGNIMALESAFAAGPGGAELAAHELGHNLNLEHVAFANLMTGTNGT